MTTQPSTQISERRLWSRIEAMARIGATARGGVHRMALGPEDAEARRLLVEWGQSRGFRCETDHAGNLFVSRAGTDAAAAPVMSGSHLDTQPKGGRFDGAYGVLAAFEALEAIDDAKIQTRRPIEAVVWSAEEGGARFSVGCIGSQAHADPAKLDPYLAERGFDGVTYGEALASANRVLTNVGQRRLGLQAAFFIEAHIEQGPILETAGKTIGVVTGIQGIRRFSVEVKGDAAHAGTTPEANRKDALGSAAAMVVGLRRLMHDPVDAVRFTIGRFVVSPNASGVVPAEVQFSIDFRHPDDAVLTKLGDQVEAVCRSNAAPCDVAVIDRGRVPPMRFEGPVPEVIRATAEGLGYRHMSILSGAGHDARYLALTCPSGMIFVPCEKGISHSEVENATPADLAAGARVLADALVGLANRC
ncbi:MAG: Zn-dependent hydrolase [Rhodospirillales bacterium]|nr:Zn-dependent hydrolase [Rhodospirillales bacterium]